MDGWHQCPAESAEPTVGIGSNDLTRLNLDSVGHYLGEHRKEMVIAHVTLDLIEPLQLKFAKTW